MTEKLVGEKQYDFSKPILLNDKLSEKSPILMENNKIVWIDQIEWNAQTKESLYEMFLAEFYPTESKITTTKVINFNIPLGKGFSNSVTILNGQVYYIQDNNLFDYDPISKNSKLLLKDVTDILGVGSGYLVLNKVDTFLYNLSSGEKINIEFLKIDKKEKILISGQNMIYVSENIIQTPSPRKKEIRNFDIVLKKDSALLNVEIPYQYEPKILINYTGDYITYDSYNNGGTAEEIVVYKISTGEKILTKPQGYYYPTGGSESTYYPEIKVGRISGDYLYYGLENKSKIIKLNLLTSKEEVLVENDESLILVTSGWWDTNGEYLVYMKHAARVGVPDFYIYLQKI